MAHFVPIRPLARRERLAVLLFFIGMVLFGLAVEKRSAFMSRRMGDLGVYLRAGWAVRQGGAELYTITDDNGWHYSYPPLFAILMAPLADPPRGAPTHGMVPYPVSVALCYALNLLCLALAVHLLATALERASPHAEVRARRAGTLRWWLLRLLPVLLFLPPVGHTLMRGQANIVLLLLLCGMIAALMRGQSLRAGLWLAGAICLKIFPAFLLLVPLVRRDRRCLAGCGLGLVVGLALVPAVVLGPARTVRCYRELRAALVEPALGVGQDQSRAKELIEVTATDSQSFLASLHNTLHLDRTTRPHVASPGVRRAHWLLGGLFTLLTLVAIRRRPVAGMGIPLFVGALVLVMILLSPVCHTHYFLLSLPAMMALIARSWDRHQTWGQQAGLVVLAVVQVVGHTLPLLPACEVLKDVGLAMYTALALWLAAVLVLRRGVAAAPATAAVRPAAAA